MDFNQRETLIFRITSGSIYISLKKDEDEQEYFKEYFKEYLVKNPSLEIRYKAQLLYNKKLEQLSNDTSLLSEDQLFDFMCRNNLWTLEDQEKFDKLPKDIENLKVQLFELVYQSNRRKEIKKILAAGRTELNNLTIKRHRFDHIIPKGNAGISKLYFLVGSSLYYFNSDKKVYKNSNWINKPNSLIHRIIVEYNNSILTENIYRELARTEPWRSIWNASKSDSLFGIPSINLSDEQKSLVFWSRLYDNIYENPDCPDDDVIEDDDLLDGWLISQRRKREKEKIDGEADRIAARHGGATEIFVPVDNPEDVKKIESMNNATAKMIKKQRYAALNQSENGVLNEADLPDVQRNLMMQANQAYSQKMKG